MGFDIISMGPLMVEMVRQEKGRKFHESGTFAGPYPSGDTPIFINAAAKMGMNCGFIGSVGDDGFGKCVYNRIKESGVDMSHIMVVPHTYTATTFVYYNEDESRDFTYHLSGSGSEYMFEGEGDAEYFKNCKWVHYTGFTMESALRAKELVYKTLEFLEPETKISYDPNLRRGLTQQQILDMAGPIVERADLILPSLGEAGLFWGTDDESGCKKWMAQGKMVVQKRGQRGSRIYHDGNITDIRAFETEEVDPTGAGDTFCAAFISCLIEGKNAPEAALFANVAGAYAVGAMGPMEGAVPRRLIEEFLASGKDRVVFPK
jgi:sugar/nucleoside kinase (ribokinase family)